MQPLEKLQKIQKLIKKVNDGGLVLIVEGKRDEASLRNIGITCEIIRAAGSRERLLSRVIAASQHVKPAILFDFDATGNERTAALADLLLAHDVVPNSFLRREFGRVFGLRFFEDVDNKLEEIERKVN